MAPYTIQAMKRHGEWIDVARLDDRERATDTAVRLSRDARWPVRVVDATHRLVVEYSPGFYGDPMVAGATVELYRDAIAIATDQRRTR